MENQSWLILQTQDASVHLSLVWLADGRSCVLLTDENWHWLLFKSVVHELCRMCIQKNKSSPVITVCKLCERLFWAWPIFISVREVLLEDLLKEDSTKKSKTSYMHTYIHTYIHAYIHTCVHTYMHTLTCIHTRTLVNTYIQTYINKYWDIWFTFHLQICYSLLVSNNL